jgi:hypothetical protein
VDFDAELWQAQRATEALELENMRSAMLPALQREHLEPGATRDAIRALLGPPESERGETDVHELGRSPMGVSYEPVAIEYDGDELVRSALRRT